MKEFFAKTKNGTDVYYDSETSHAKTHFDENERLLEFTKQAIEQHEAIKDEERFEVDMQTTTGKSDLIKLEEGDETFYAIRKMRDKYSHFVKNRLPQETTFITVALKKVNDGTYNLYTCWVGQNVPSFLTGPEDPRDDAREFWSKHALAVGKQEIMEETITNDYPW